MRGQVGQGLTADSKAESHIGAMIWDNIGNKASLTPAVIDFFICNAVPIFLATAAALVSHTLASHPRHACLTPHSGATLNYGLPSGRPSSAESKIQLHIGTASIEGSPVDLHPLGWEACEDRDSQVIMLTEAQLQSFLCSYGQNIFRSSKSYFSLLCQLYGFWNR